MNIEDAKQLAKQGDREGAIAMLRQMLEQNEGERELVLLELGVVYNASDKPSEWGDAYKSRKYKSESLSGYDQWDTWLLL